MDFLDWLIPGESDEPAGSPAGEFDSTLKHHAGQHNQKRHGWRFAKGGDSGAKLAAARSSLRGRDQGERDEYRKRAGMAQPAKVVRPPAAPQQSARVKLVRDRLEKVGETAHVKALAQAEKDLAQVDIDSQKLSDEMNAANTAAGGWTTAQRADFNNRNMQQYQRRAAAQKAVDSLRENVEQQYIDALAVDNPISITPLFSGISNKRQQELSGALAQVCRVISKDVADPSVAFSDRQAKVVLNGSGGVRASYSGRGQINIKSGGARTLAHEMGHYIEDISPTGGTINTSYGTARRVTAVNAKAKAFLDERTKGERARSLAKLSGNTQRYGKTEFAKPDKFLDPYMGKIYDDGSTEIMSMGLEMLITNPLRLMRSDPDTFDFLIGVLQGD